MPNSMPWGVVTPAQVVPTDRRCRSRATRRRQELLYSARIALHRTELQIDDRIVRLAPGMAVTVEIKTGTQNASHANEA